MGKDKNKTKKKLIKKPSFKQKKSKIDKKTEITKK